MAESQFRTEAHDDPYGFTDKDALAGYLDEVEIVPVDATKSDDVASDMTWAQSHIGSGGPLSITDYGRHRRDCETLADFADMARERLLDGMGTQYLKFMDDDKTKVADTLVAISKANGFVVLPYFGDEL